MPTGFMVYIVPAFSVNAAWDPYMEPISYMVPAFSSGRRPGSLAGGAGALTGAGAAAAAGAGAGATFALAFGASFFGAEKKKKGDRTSINKL